MSKFDFDLFVIGAGSGGVRAGRMAAQLGLRVGVAEESRPGGTCVVRGCVPKKYLVYGADYGASFKKAKGYGWTAENVTFDWATLRDNIQTETARLSGIYSGILERNGATLFSERAEFVDAHTLKLTTSGKTVTAEKILIAVGGRPWMPNLEGAEHAITSDEAFVLPEFPKRALVVGGGYIACEFAGIFAGLGVETVQAYRGDALLRGFDDDVREKVGNGQKINNIDVRLHTDPVKIETADNGYLVTFKDGSTLETDAVMMATGRKAHTPGLGLENAGVETDKNGAVVVDEFSKTSQEHIYAVGDVTDRVNLTPVAIREAMAFIDTAFKNNPRGYDHSNIASAVFSRPPVGSVGMSEAQAREAHDDVVIYETDFRPMANILSGSEHRYYIKVVTAGPDETVIGVHIVGDYAGEVIQAVGIAVKAGLTKADFDATCAVHPTMSEELVTLTARKD